MTSIVKNALLAISLITIAGLAPTTTVFAQETLPLEYRDLNWYWFQTDNFEIVSIDWETGWQARQRVEALREWTYKRWGFNSIDFDKKCMIICVPDQQTFNKWWRKSPNINPRAVKSRNSDGSEREVYAIWLAAEGSWLTSVLPEKVAQVSFMAAENVHGIKLSPCMMVGMSALCNDVNTIRGMFYDLKPTNSRELFNATSVGDVTDPAFRAQAAAACLLLRKQMEGDVRFLQFLQAYSDTGNASQALAVFGWRGFEDFNHSFSAYSINLAYDIRNKKTPDMGLVWFVD